LRREKPGEGGRGNVLGVRKSFRSKRQGLAGEFSQEERKLLKIWVKKRKEIEREKRDQT